MRPAGLDTRAVTDLPGRIGGRPNDRPRFVHDRRL
jgi:hypothetical protein